MTRAYKIAVVVNPKLSEAETERLGHAFKEILKKYGGEITNEEIWGRRPTAYRLKGHDEAFYAFYYVSLDAAKIFALDQELKLTENILRHLITLAEDETETVEEGREEASV
jgi:small subunit ribosomal protein S6